MKKGNIQAEKTSNRQQRTMTRNLKYEVNLLFKKKEKKKKAQLLKVMPQGQEMATGGQPVERVCALLCFLVSAERKIAAFHSCSSSSGSNNSGS